MEALRDCWVTMVNMEPNPKVKGESVSNESDLLNVNCVLFSTATALNHLPTTGGSYCSSPNLSPSSSPPE